MSQCVILFQHLMQSSFLINNSALSWHLRPRTITEGISFKALGKRLIGRQATGAKNSHRWCLLRKGQYCQYWRHPVSATISRYPSKACHVFDMLWFDLGSQRLQLFVTWTWIVGLQSQGLLYLALAIFGYWACATIAWHQRVRLACVHSVRLVACSCSFLSALIFFGSIAASCRHP